MTTHSRQGDEPREGVVLPSNGEPWIPGQNDEPQVTPDQGQPWGQPWGPAAAPPPPPHSPQQPHGALPPQVTAPGGAEETQLLPPQGGLPPAVPEGAADETQLIPPMTGPADDSTRQLRQVRRPLPPESSAHQPAAHQPHPLPQAQAQPEAPTQALPQTPPQAPEPPPGAPFGIRPGEPGDRQPPSEFDSLFRPEPAAATPDATQQLPVFDQAAAAQGHGQPPYEPPPTGRGRRRADASGGGWNRNPVLLGAVGVIAIVGAGLLGGYALGGGGDDGTTDEAQGKPSAPADESQEPKAASDPAEEQAKALDKLLGDSNNSRDAVISSVENIKKCEKLGKAAQDLRNAAKQRNGLVNRLNELTIDELPNHQRLSNQLTKAWKASAAADNHYAAWADQVAGKKGCHKGQARTTGQLAKGNKSSGDATAAKRQAAKLWNPTAREHNLTERQPAQL